MGRRAQALEETATRLRAQTPAAVVETHPCDLTDPDAVTTLVDELAAHGVVDVLVANAGGQYGRWLPGEAHAIAEGWRRDLDGNVLATVMLGECLLPHLRRPGGRIVAMSSIASLRGAGSYGAAKAAVNAWVMGLSSILAGEGITVNAVAPGFVPDTGFWSERLAADPGIVENKTKDIPVGRPGLPEEVAEAVAHLASEAAGWTTGQILQVNGGAVLGRG